MTNHIVGVDPAEPIPVVDHRAYCDVWAQDEDGLVLVSFLGPHTVLQALWAHLSAGHTIELAGGTLLHRQNQAAHAEEESSQAQAENAYKIRYFRMVVRFVDIAQAHLVMVAEPATLQVRPGQRSYLLAAQLEGDAERFFALWNRSVPLPARESWAEYLWTEGLRRGPVRPIAAYGCLAWAIEPEPEPWQEIIAWGIEDRVLK